MPVKKIPMAKVATRKGIKAKANPFPTKAPKAKERESNSEGAKSPMARGLAVGKMARAAGSHGASDNAPGRKARPASIKRPIARKTAAIVPTRKMPAPRAGDGRSEGARSPMSRQLSSIKSPMNLRRMQGQTAKGKGGPDIGKFAREVSTNFGRGVSEVGRQLGSIKVKNPLDRAGRKDPLAGRSIQNAVDFGSKSNASNNPLKAILKPKK